MTAQRKILVVSQSGGDPAGEMFCNPLRYFQFAQSQTLSLNICIERSSSAEIRATQTRDVADAIIVGGGAILGHPSMEAHLAFWVGVGVPLILWSTGIGHATEHSLSDTLFFPEQCHQTRHFSLIGLRDFGTGFNWVPSGSCMDSAFGSPAPQGKGIAFVLDKKRLSAAKLKQATDQSSHSPIAWSNNPFPQQIDILRNSETVVTNSYEAAYWATLLGKRVICIDGSPEAKTLKHAPVFANAENWSDFFHEATHYPEALEECRDTNIDFGKKAAKLIGSSNRGIPFERNPVEERRIETSLVPAPALAQNVVPRIIHFVFGLSPDFGGKPFNLMHQIAILSAKEQIKPEEIFFHYRTLPDGDLFEVVKNLMTLVQLPSGRSNMPKHFAHQADIIRLETLYDRGGIYLDLDTITTASFDPLLRYAFTLGLQGRARLDGLCNAVILAEPSNQSVKDWLDSYSRFADTWDLFSVRLPYVQWRSGKWDIHVEPYDTFHWPSWGADGLRAMFERDVHFSNARCHHLWETMAQPKYFPYGTEQIDDLIREGKSTYSRLAKPYR